MDGGAILKMYGNTGMPERTETRSSANSTIFAKNIERLIEDVPESSFSQTVLSAGLSPQDDSSSDRPLQIIEEFGTEYLRDDGLRRNILMLYRGLQVGGIETLIVRLSGFLVQAGFSVSVAASDGPLVHSLDKRVDFLELPKDLNHIHISRSLAPLFKSDANFILMSFDPLSRFISEYCLSRRHIADDSQNIVHISGCFHPRAYFHEVDNWLHRTMNIIIARILGNQGLYFMNEPCRTSHTARLKLHESEGKIVQIPVKISKEIWAPHAESELKIIAVGRLVNFKAYNFGLIDVAEYFFRNSVPLTINIYGYGEQHDAILQEISRRGLEGIIKLPGPLSYEKFTAEVLRHDLFVGMGTAALEAAATGIPTIFAVDSERNDCLGFTHELPAGSVGERVEGHEMRALIDCVWNYHLLDDCARSELGRLGREFAQRNSEGHFFSELANVIRKSPPWRPSYVSRFSLFIYFKLTQTAPKWKNLLIAALRKSARLD